MGPSLERMIYPENDDEFEDVTVEKIEINGDHVVFTVDSGWTFGGVTVEQLHAAGMDMIYIGDRIRTYGTLGRPVRGVFVRGKKVYYRTKEEQNEIHRIANLAAQQARQLELDESKIDRDQRRAKLPQVFQRRLNGFERRNPEWRRDYCGAVSPPFEGSFPDWVRGQIKDLKGYALGHRRKDGRYRVMTWDLDRETITPWLPDGTPAHCLTCPCPKEAGRLRVAGKPKRSSPFRQIKVLCYPEEVSL